MRVANSQHWGPSHLIKASYRDVLKALGEDRSVIRHVLRPQIRSEIRRRPNERARAHTPLTGGLVIAPRLSRPVSTDVNSPLFVGALSLFPAFLAPSVSKLGATTHHWEKLRIIAQTDLTMRSKSTTVYLAEKQLILLGMRGALSVRRNTTESRFIPSDFIKANRFIYTSPRLLNSLVVTVRNC